MSNSKNHNSIVFLTTLSVYLGLVLVGATPLVLAQQAALTQKFEIQNEREIEDDLDKNPDEQETEKFSEINIPGLFVRFFSELETEIKNGTISFPVQTDLLAQAKYKLPDDKLQGFVQNFVSKKFNDESVFDKGQQKIKFVGLEANESDLASKVSFDKNNAASFAGFLAEKFSSNAVLTDDNLLKRSYENTFVTSENDQVFTVTNLPRASIDPLLAEQSAN